MEMERRTHDEFTQQALFFTMRTRGPMLLCFWQQTLNPLCNAKIGLLRIVIKLTTNASIAQFKV